MCLILLINHNLNMKVFFQNVYSSCPVYPSYVTTGKISVAVILHWVLNMFSDSFSSLSSLFTWLLVCIARQVIPLIYTCSLCFHLKYSKGSNFFLALTSSSVPLNVSISFIIKLLEIFCYDIISTWFRFTTPKVYNEIFQTTWKTHQYNL